MSEQEMRHKEELYEAEKSIIVGKSMYVLLKGSIIFVKNSARSLENQYTYID